MTEKEIFISKMKLRTKKSATSTGVNYRATCKARSRKKKLLKFAL